MNETNIDDITNFETEQEKKDKAKNMLKVPLNLDKDEYLLKLYLSEEKNSIIFKLEKEKTFIYFYFEKYFLHDFKQKSRIFMIDYSITQILAHLKKLIAKSQNEIILENKEVNIMNIIIKNEIDNYVLNFEVKKIILAQNQLNPKLVEQIQENKVLIELLKQQYSKLSKELQIKNDLINNFNNDIANIKKSKNEININYTNIINNNINNINNIQNINNNLNNTDKKENEEKKDINKEEKKEEKMEEKKEDISNNSSNSNSNNNNNKTENKLEDKRYISNNRKKKNKKNNKKIKFYYGNNQNKNNQNNNKSQEDNSIFCFENVEIIGNKKIFELLVVFNVIMILIILCLIGSIYSIKSNLEYEKVLEEEFMNKLSYLNGLNDYGDDDYGHGPGIGDWDQSDFLFENEQQKLYFKEELISKENNKIKDIEFILKYKSSRDGKNDSDFLKSCQGYEHNLLLIRNDKGQKFALVSKNFQEVLKGNKMGDSKKFKKNFVLYNINKHDIFEYNFTKNLEDIYNAFMKALFSYLNDKIEFEDSRMNILGRIVEIELYELKYIK